MNKVSILVADDHKIVRMGLKSLFAAARDLSKPIGAPLRLKDLGGVYR